MPSAVLTSMSDDSETKMGNKKNVKVSSISSVTRAREEDHGIAEGQVKKIGLDEIDFEDTEFCFRVDFNVRDLMDDIKRNGQQFPVILRRKEDAGKYQIISGFRRCHTLRELKVSDVKAIVRDDMSDDRAYHVSYVENEKRKNLNGIDKAHAISKLSSRGKSPEEIQLIFGIGERQYYRYKKAIDFPEEIKDAITDRFIGVTHGLILNEAYSRHKTTMDLEQWIDWIIENKASIRQLKRHIDKSVGKSRKTKDFIKRTPNGGFRLLSAVFDPSRTDRECAHKLKENLKEAIQLLEIHTTDSGKKQ